MEYPDDFETPAFPAGKSINSTRLVSIITMVVFLLIVIACGGILWIQQSIKVHPFLVSINNITGQWEIIGHEHDGMSHVPTRRSLQESVIGKFLRSWFFVSNIESARDATWKSCDRSINCGSEYNTNSNILDCALYCIASDNLYEKFINNVVPGYLARIDSGETWELIPSSVQITPIDKITDAGATWQIRAQIRSNLSDVPINILAYALVKKSDELYPQTLGYYIDDFNAYKIN
ncbi:MAG: VirB8/TrbF family protein [Alphaproteobacteria bacterium]|nr:VirB8/TrbF family protein [Alphaproteobacteria bacterium]